MSATADHLLDRRRLRRSLTLWRVLAVLLAIAALAGLGYAFGGGRNLVGVGPEHIARITISGFISGSRNTLQLIDRVADAKNVSAVILSIDSPGGSASGAEGLYDSLRRLAEKKPMVAVVNGMAASGGYIAALGADRILTRQTAFVGSIGVLIQFPNVSKLLNSIGVNVEEIKSSPLKAAPNGLEPTSPEARKAMEAVIADSYAWFKNLVKTRRSLDDSAAAVVSDGRVFTGHQAVELKLADAIGGEKEAVDWLVANRNVKKDLSIRDWRPQSDSSRFDLWTLAAFGARLFGQEGAASALERTALTQDLMNGYGLMAIWLPVKE